MLYSGTKCLSNLLLFPSIVLHSTIKLFMIGPLQWKSVSPQSTKLCMSRVATFINIILRSGCIFLVALLFQTSSRDDIGNTLLGSKKSGRVYTNDTYRVWKHESKNDRYSIYDPSAVSKIVVLVLSLIHI